MGGRPKLLSFCNLRSRCRGPRKNNRNSTPESPMLGEFPAKLGPETSLNGSGTKHGTLEISSKVSFLFVVLDPGFSGLPGDLVPGPWGWIPGPGEGFGRGSGRPASLILAAECKVLQHAGRRLDGDTPLRYSPETSLQRHTPETHPRETHPSDTPQ